jgi:hypothetical protein
MEEAGGPTENLTPEQELLRKQKIEDRAWKLQELFASTGVSLNTFSDKFAAKAYV